MSLDAARKIADAVLYEGYVLYPYRASAGKNRMRWQFGVLAPETWSEVGGCEHWWMQSECLVEVQSGAEIAATVRFLQLNRRTVEEAIDGGEEFRRTETLEVDGRLLTSWEEGIERTVDLSTTVPPQPREADEHVISFSFPAMHEAELIRDARGRIAARIVRELWAVRGKIRLDVVRVAASSNVWALRIRIENTTATEMVSAPRDHVVPSFFVGTHILLEAQCAAFLSLTDPPEWARAATLACRNARLWPVLVGGERERTVMLASPIILEDHPRIAPESPGDLFDATEIDEILTLRTLALTDEEKREARATDPRAAAIIDRTDAMPPEVMERLHGTIRYLREVTAPSADETRPPWWDPAAEAAISPHTDQLHVRGTIVARGSRVRLRPVPGRADAQDMFLDARVGRVEAVFSDVDGKDYVAVCLEDDPAAEFMQWHGRYLYFSPDEVEPLEGNE